MKFTDSVAVFIENTDAIKLPLSIGNALDEIGHPNTRVADSTAHFTSLVRYAKDCG